MMTILTGDFRDVAGAKSSGTVTVTSTLIRPAHSTVGQTVTRERHTFALRDGMLKTTELDPGPVVVEVSAGAEWTSWNIDIPAQGVHDISALIDQQVQWSPPVVLQAQAARDEAVANAKQVRVDATHVAEDRARVDEVVADGAAAVRAHVSAEADRAEAGMAGAQTAQGDAEVARDGAAAAQIAAEAARDRGVVAETRAGELCDASAVSAAGAQVSRTGADESASKAADSARASVESADAAKLDASRSEVARDGAEASAAAAARSEGVAATAAEDAAQEVRDDFAEMLAETAGQAVSAEASAKAAAQSAKDAESVVADGVPDASTSIKGKLKLAGDLGGTADAPTVPGLADKASKSDVESGLARKISHTNIGSRLYGTESGGVAALVEYSISPGPGTVAYRKADGSVEVGAPTSSADATPKAYVDGAIAEAVGDVDLSEFEAKLDAKADKAYVDEAAGPAAVVAVDARIQVVESMPGDTDPGVIYLVTGSTPL